MAFVLKQFILDSEGKVHKSNRREISLYQDKTEMYLIFDLGGTAGDGNEIVIDIFDLINILEEWQG